MARFSLYLIIGLLLGALLASVMADDSGYVLLRWRGWQFETSLWLAVGLGVFLTVLLVLLRGLFRSTFRMPKRLRHWFGLRSVRGAQRRADKGMTAFFEGRWDVAERTLSTVPTSEARTVLLPLYTAVAAFRKGDFERAENILNQAEHCGEMPPHLVLIARAECHLVTQDYGQARQILDGLSGSEQALPRARKLFAHIAYAQKAWAELIALIADLRQYHQVPVMLIDRWERDAYSALMADEAQPSQELLSLWRRAPSGLKEEGSAVWAVLIRNLVARGEWDLLQKALTDRLSDHFDMVSVDAAQMFPDRQAVKLEKVLRQWIDKDSDGRCHAALAAIAEREGKTSEAGELWQQAYALAKRPQIGAQWSRWLRQQGDVARATQIEQESLRSLSELK
jgi:HemY protein